MQHLLFFNTLCFSNIEEQIALAIRHIVLYGLFNDEIIKSQ